MEKIPLIIGHRGASWRAPENTLASFRLAWEEGADGIECDFRLTADGRIVCLHDATTGRVATTDLEVAATPLALLRSLDLGSWRGAEWAGETMPTLDELLAALPDGKLLFMELKSGPEILAPLVRLLHDAGLPGERLRILAFDAELVRECRRLMPGIGACWLTDYRWWRRYAHWRPAAGTVMATLRRIGAIGLASRDRAVLDREFVVQLREAGMEIHVWTVDDPAAARRLAELGVDSIMTNCPAELRRGLTGMAAHAPSGESS